MTRIFKVLHVSAEVAPFATVGGLSRVMQCLPAELHALGTDVRIFTAKYGEHIYGENKRNIHLTDVYNQLAVPTSTTPITHIICNIKSYTQNTGIITYFLENKEYFEKRANTYGYIDDHVRFYLLSQGCLEWLLTSDWQPDIIHCHDWHTAYLPALTRDNPRYAPIRRNAKIIFTIHNLAYQGNYDFRYGPHTVADTGHSSIKNIYDPGLLTQNALLRGALTADYVSTVSQAHAIEITTKQYGEGLERHLRKLPHAIKGILNGLDTKTFDPSTDRYVKHKYNVQNYQVARTANKKFIQKHFHLPENNNAFLIGSIGRIAPQKGWDLILDVLPHLFTAKPDVQCVVLGNGDEYYAHRLRFIADEFPDNLALHLRANFELPRQLFASCDATLIASSYEPGGIVALEALRYGSVPIVRRTGGLGDVIVDFDPRTALGNGFSFTQKTQWALYGSIIEAFTVFRQTSIWDALVKNCLQADHSWTQSAQAYKTWYTELLT